MHGSVWASVMPSREDEARTLAWGLLQATKVQKEEERARPTPICVNHLTAWSGGVQKSMLQRTVDNELHPRDNGSYYKQAKNIIF